MNYYPFLKNAFNPVRYIILSNCIDPGHVTLPVVVEASVIGHALMGLPLDDLILHPERLLSGDEFRQAGIYNVIESGFFDWILLAEGASGTSPAP